MPIAVVVHLAVGLGFALAARERVRVDGPFGTPAFPLVLMHAVGVVAPIALYFYAAHPAWSGLYLIDPADVPALATVPLLVGHAALVIGAYYAGAWLIRADRRKVILYALAALGVAGLALLLVTRGRLGVAGSHAAYHAGRGRDLMEVELGWAVVVSLLALSASAGYVVFELGRDGRRVRAR